MPAMPAMPGMPGMQMPSMYPMMMGNNAAQEVDPLHIQHFVPQNQNLNIDNFGVNPTQLTAGPQLPQQSAQTGGANFRSFNSYDAFVSKFM
jgi:hypothetical protein